jgi:hypothetical protein
MTDARALVGRTAAKIATREDRTFVTFVDRNSMDVTELRLFFDGRFEVDPEPEGSDNDSLGLAIYLRLGEIPGCTVDDADISPEGDLHLEFTNGIQVTAFGPPAEEPPYTTWQLQERG